jgi:hypothetical protein
VSTKHREPAALRGWGTKIGAAFAVTVGGVLTVDLWRGSRIARPDAQSGAIPSTSSSPAPRVSSPDACSCSLTAVHFVSTHRAEYWPDFVSHGKYWVRVLDLASQRACLPGFKQKVGEDEFVSDRRMASSSQSGRRRAIQVRRTSTTDSLTAGCVVSSCDASTVEAWGWFSQRKWPRRLGLSLCIGLPAELAQHVATIEHLCVASLASRPARAIRSSHGFWNNPPLFPADHIPSNRELWHRAEIPGHERNRHSALGCPSLRLPRHGRRAWMASICFRRKH